MISTYFRRLFCTKVLKGTEINVGDEMGMKNMTKRSIRKAKGRRRKQQWKSMTEHIDDVRLRDSTAEYYFDSGLRKLYPYMCTYNTYAKQRWFHRTLLDVFQDEFQSERNVHKYFAEGNFTVNGKIAAPDYVLQDHDFLQKTVHRHEHPVLAAPIEVIADTADVLVVNKPASIPCHPCGRYKYNSLTSILHKEHGYQNLRMLNRLDRVTSGVIIMPKTDSVSFKMEMEQKNRQVHKEYLARVVGKFPDGEVICNQPLSMMSYKICSFKVCTTGKTCSTTFQRISYNGRTSVVKCWPHTGRTHQIRVHLQFLGYPIVNDNLYNSPAFGEGRGKGGMFSQSDEQIAFDIWKLHNRESLVIEENPLYHKQLTLNNEHMLARPAGSLCSSTGDRAGDLCQTVGSVASGCNTVNGQYQSLLDGVHTCQVVGDAPSCGAVCDSSLRTVRDEIVVLRPISMPCYDESKVTIVEDCYLCRYRFSDPPAEDLVLYLHAAKYTGPDWQYSASLPDWAADDWLDGDS